MPDEMGNARRVLRLLEERDMDGYTLMSKAGLKLSELEQAVEFLLQKRMLRVKGEIRGPRLAESWFQIVPHGWHQSSGTLAVDW